MLTVPVLTAAPAAASTLVEVSSDPYTVKKAQDATEAEADTYHWGSNVVSTFQVGRYAGGGAVNIGWATSTDAGATWQHGFLPGITVAEGGVYPRASDPVVAYDAKHGTWLINTLNIAQINDLSVSRSPDGLTWSGPVPVVAGTQGTFIDKNWIACDSTATSPFYGTCYVLWDDAGAGGQVLATRSTDGGLTWSAPAAISGAAGIGVQPVVQPNGHVVVPYRHSDGSMRSFLSSDGGATWSAPVLVTTALSHGPTGMRAPRLPSAEVDGSGRVYLVWHDCRFRPGCTANDIVLATSGDGVAWSAVSRIPTSAADSTADAFIPGIGADHATSGGTARLGLYFYYFPDAGCSKKTCALHVGYLSSGNGGTTWGAASTLAGPMSLDWIADAGGAMVGDYLSCDVINGQSVSVFAVAGPNDHKVFDQAMFAPAGGLPTSAG
ncbi:MAG TPA: sialidase family protein [Kribbellaceae bacterium]|jgi:hypothetical protein